MDETLIISLIIVVFLAILGCYMVYQLIKKYRVNQKQTIRSLILLITSFTLGNIFIAVSPNFQENRSVLGWFTLIGLEFAVLVLFSLQLFSRSISGASLNKTQRFITTAMYIATSIIVLLPSNHWGIISIYELNNGVVSTQIISHIILILLSLHTFSVSIVRIGRAESNIHDIALKESFLWIKRSFYVLLLYIPSLILNLVSYLLQPETTLDFMIFLYGTAILTGTLTGAVSLFVMYLGITLPEMVMKRLYKKYLPMWDKGAKKEKQKKEFMQNLKKLQDSLFD